MKPQLEKVCMVPRLSGLGGMVSFQHKLAAGLAQRSIQVTYDLEDPDCHTVLVVGGTRQVAALWRARRRGARILQRLNGMNWLHRKQPTSLKQYLRAEGNNLLLAFIRRQLASGIVYQSEFSQRWWERVRGQVDRPAWVVYNGVDLSLYTPQGAHQRPAESCRLLLVEGHLGGNNQLGLENAVRLTQALNERYHFPMELMVVGDVPAELRERWQARAGGGITWAGVRPREHIPQTDRSAHLLFSADLNAACPNSVVEALACGLPVAAFDTGALAEMVPGDAGRVVPYGGDPWNLEAPDIPALAAAAAEMLAGQERFRAAARARAEAVFGLDRMVDGYLEAFLA